MLPKSSPAHSVEAGDLPPAIQPLAVARIRQYWRLQVLQILIAEIFLYFLGQSYPNGHPRAYAIPMLLTIIPLLFSIYPGMEMFWFMGMAIVFVAQGILFKGLGAVTAVSLLLPYTFASMILPGRRRLLVQACCVVGFWVCLVYELFPINAGYSPIRLILVSYSLLIAAYTFQGARFLIRLALELNTAYVAGEITQRSQQFLARVSHELRTPLNSILGFAKMLRITTQAKAKSGSAGDSILSPTQLDYLRQIVDEGEQLNHLVGDLLDSAQLVTGKLSLKVAPCDLNQICTAVADEIKSILKPTLSLLLDLQPDLPTINGDGLRLRQIVRNLVGNAAKYTPHGEITIHTRLREAHSQDYIDIAVQDTGPGIPEDQQELVFVPFVKLDGHSAGIGLGLDIAQQLARLHGGIITLESVLNQGSIFTLSIPVNFQFLAPAPVEIIAKK